ncbi:MAG: cell division ATP-binding protein FtsE [Chloroflexi bacterium]|nr:cell division ATP-binding protein FtsE [Chloroflexota bacterium]
MTDVGEGETPVVSLNNVSVRYPSGHVALAGVSLTLNRGEFAFLVGPSGAGKSSLVGLLVRDVLPFAGEVHVAGYSVHGLPTSEVPYLRRRVGVVFQDFRLLQRRTVRENTAFALEVTGAPAEEIEVVVERALRIVGLGKLADRYPDALSGGEQQRAAIARAIVGNPELLIADEPTGNLDPLISWEIMELLGQINQLGVTVLVATHDSDIVTTLRRRVLALESGRLIRDEQRGTYHRVG